MHLTANQLTHMLTAPQPNATNLAHETRGEHRVDTDVQATILPLALCDSVPATVTVRDLSRTGIGILSPQPMTLDQQFVLLLPQSEDSPALVLCAVTFWQPISRDVYAIGARFTRILRDSAAGLPFHPETQTAPTVVDSPLRRSA